MRGMCFICFINAYINILILWNLNSLYYSATIHNYFQNYSSDIATRETILRIVKYRQINMSGLKKKKKRMWMTLLENVLYYKLRHMLS